MTRQEAAERCAALNAQEGGQSARWMPQQVRTDTWRVVNVAVPGLQRPDPLRAVVEAKPRPPEPPDPRPALIREFPPWGPV